MELSSYLTANGATDPNGSVGQEGTVIGNNNMKLILTGPRRCFAPKLHQPDERQLYINGCEYINWHF